MLKDILSISGKGGLYKYISQGRNGIIVESLHDKKRINATATAKISSLEDISVFTEDGEVSLEELFKKIKEKENGGPAISHKASNDELKKYFAEILPEYDRERVYVSDIKKIISWYNILQGLEMLDFSEEDDNAEQVDSTEEPEGGGTEQPDPKETTEDEGTEQPYSKETTEDEGTEQPDSKEERKDKEAE